MSVGNSANTNPAALNSQLGGYAVQLRNLLTQIKQYAEWFDGLSAAEQASLFGITQGSADNTTLTNSFNYLNTIVGVYFGTVQAGGTGGTGAIDFDYDNALSVLWGGQ